MPNTKRFTEDTADPLVVQLGTPQNPQNLTDWTCQIVLKNLSTGARITTGTTIIQTPATDGRVQRAWESGELVGGNRYAVEVVATLPSAAGTRTYPGPLEDPLIVEITARRT